MGANAYTGNYLYNQTNTSNSTGNSIPQYRKIKDYDIHTHLLELDTSGPSSNGSGPVNAWSASDIYSIRKEIPQTGKLNNANSSILSFSLPISFSSEQNAYTNSFIHNTTNNETLRITRYETFSGTALSGTTSTVSFPSNASAENNYYVGCHIQFLSGPAFGRVSEIVSYKVSGTFPNLIKTANVSPPFIAAPSTGDKFTFRSGFVENSFAIPAKAGDNFELLKFSYDNHNPFLYSGSQVSQQELVCYRIELLNLSLPNKILSSGEGNLISFYPYVYVELSNVSGFGSKNTIYSNNPNAKNMLFRVAVDDNSTPSSSKFINIDSDGMVQTLKFKPNDNLRFSVYLSNGELFKVVEPEHTSPSPPNSEIQISAVFSIKRL